MNFMNRVISHLGIIKQHIFNRFCQALRAQKRWTSAIVQPSTPEYHTTRSRSEQTMEYTAADVKKLREQTGATFADCKNALAEAKSWEEANKIIEARSDKKAEKMIAAGRETKQGGIFSYVHHNNSLGVLLELNCRTDFVARSENFHHIASNY